jgi:AcrR family transcriptional regulator
LGVSSLPKQFSIYERSVIKKHLKQEGKICLERYGMKKTTIDELVKRVNIPKGTFYLFYDSKELLFYDILIDLHDLLQQTFLSQVQQYQGLIEEEEVTELIFNLYKSIDASFLPSFIASGELELLLRKLPPEVISEHAKKDDFRVEQLLSLLSLDIPRESIEVFSASLRGIFFFLFHKKEIGENIFDKALYQIIKGLVLQLF